MDRRVKRISSSEAFDGMICCQVIDVQSALVSDLMAEFLKIAATFMALSASSVNE
jgi:hypothetical protein